jgi:hypothetical protein
VIAGLYAAIGIQAALVEREIAGQALQSTDAEHEGSGISGWRPMPWSWRGRDCPRRRFT